MSRARVPSSFIQQGPQRFLIVDSPTDADVDEYIAEFRKVNVTDVVRACESLYSPAKLVAAGLRVHEMPFTDGDAPPAAIVRDWLKVCSDTFGKENKDNKTVALHCIAGLGRTPVLVAIALIEGGMEPLDAVTRIRAVRRGAINAKQLHFLEHTYKRKSKAGCVIM